jgi:hypothetical protein
MTTYEPILAELKRVEDEHLLQPGALSILVGRDAYDELVDGIAKSMEPSDELRELAVIAAGGKLRDLVVEGENAAREFRRRSDAAWGKEGSFLFGVPLVCDDNRTGFEVRWEPGEGFRDHLPFPEIQAEGA